MLAAAEQSAVAAMCARNAQGEGARIYLHVRVGDEPAQRLYRRAQYRVAAEESPFSLQTLMGTSRKALMLKEPTLEG